MDNTQIRAGMTVREADGDKLGEVIQVLDDGFIVEKGVFFPKDYRVLSGHVSEIRDDEIWLTVNKDDLRRAEEASAMEPSAADRAYVAAESSAQEQRIPLSEEQIEVQKRTHEAGEVRVRKEVVTEQVPISVGVAHEEVRVERVPASASTAAPREAFEEGEVRVPVMEEEVEITKRPVVREEVRISKERHQEQLSATESVRHEEIDIDESGRVRSTPESSDTERLGAPSRTDDLDKRR